MNETALLISVARNGQEIGEWHDHTVRELYGEGQLQASDCYWHEGMSEWKPLRDLFKPSLPPMPQHVPPPVPSQRPTPLPPLPLLDAERTPRMFPRGKPRTRDWVLPFVFSMLAGYVLIVVDWYRGHQVPSDFGLITARVLGTAIIFFVISLGFSLRSAPEKRFRTSLVTIGLLVIALAWVSLSQ